MISEPDFNPNGEYGDDLPRLVYINKQKIIRNESKKFQKIYIRKLSILFRTLADIIVEEAVGRDIFLMVNIESLLTEQEVKIAVKFGI